MSKKRLVFFMVFMWSLSFLALNAETEIAMKMRFFEGIRRGQTELPNVVTSSYLQLTVTANIESKILLGDEEDQIKKVFNLKDVRLVTDADLNWKSRMGDLSHIFRLNGREYKLLLASAPGENPAKSKKGREGIDWHRFRIDIAEILNGEETNLLDTEVILPEKNTAVFGFEDQQGNPYFLSLNITNVMVSPPPSPPAPPPPPNEIERARKIEEFEKGAVKVQGDLKPPKLIKRVDPVYPREARDDRVEGVVILGVRTDETGHVAAAMVYKGKSPHLNEAAVVAVRQWVYEPLVIRGESVPSVFTVTVRFVLEEKAPEKLEGVVRLDEGLASPRLIKRVNPVYPEEARKSGIQGIVLLEAQIDEQGRVSQVKILKSESAILNDPAVDAVKQWVYEPYIVDGKPARVLFTVTIRFKLS
ncbi:MAG: energy transducer TonB [Candidatus Aminicenantes bacterium]|nr:energy transducer TonB [Candidatus Aminicenantes bacterium]